MRRPLEKVEHSANARVCSCGDVFGVVDVRTPRVSFTYDFTVLLMRASIVTKLSFQYSTKDLVS
jgi:hypothetical protein